MVSTRYVRTLTGSRGPDRPAGFFFRLFGERNADERPRPDKRPTVRSRVLPRLRDALDPLMPRRRLSDALFPRRMRGRQHKGMVVVPQTVRAKATNLRPLYHRLQGLRPTMSTKVNSFP